MANINVKLNDLYSVEPNLRKKVVDEYMALGIDKLLTVMLDEPCQSVSSKGFIIYVLLDGCHKGRALLELGYTKTVSMDYFGHREGTEDILLRDAQILEDEEYIEWQIQAGLRNKYDC